MHKVKIIFWLVIISQLIMMPYPLMDTTEARYADIARRMLELNDWITPWFDENQPFWGKPPLSFWITMLGFKLFGVNEFGARFFYWVTSLGVLFFTYKTAKVYSKENAFYTPAILLSFFLFYLSSSAVMTDMPLLLGAAIVLYAQINMIILGAKGKLLNSCLLGIGIAIGMLAKGPISLILFITPLFVWTYFKSNFQTLRKGLTLWIVVLVAVVISFPWFLMAEIKTPGFMEYFIIGEHWNRYLIQGWKGDLYGNAHDFPRGSIWLFFLFATVPWSVVLAGLVLRRKFKKIAYSDLISNDVNILLVLWVFIPLIFFSLSGNILWTYVLPSLPAAAAVISICLSKYLHLSYRENLIKICLCTVLIIKICLLTYIFTSHKIDYKTTKYLIEDINKLKIPITQVYFLGQVPFSARFYGNGQIKDMPKNMHIAGKLPSRYYVVVKKNQTEYLDSHRCKDIVLQRGKYQVLFCK